MTFAKYVVATALGLAMWVPQVASARSIRPNTFKPKFITEASAKRLVKQVVRDQKWGTSFKWNVTLKNDVRGIGLKSFVASVKWGKGPHIQIAVPTYKGVVDLNKQAWSPKGKARVTRIGRAAEL